MRSVGANCQRPRDSDDYIVPTRTPWSRVVSTIVGASVMVWCWQVYKKKDITVNTTHLAILLKLLRMIIEKVTLNNIKLS